jgi:tetratricopeptide (TPR) repeat protein
MQSSNPVIPRLALSLALALGALAAASSSNAAAPPPRPAAQQEFWAHYDKKDWGPAMEEAQRLVAQARADAAQQPLALSTALTLLGNAQLSGGDKVSAEASYREALQLVESQGGAASPALVDPLRGLGYSLALLDRHGEAIPYLERALIIGRRSYGLFDPSQQGMLRQLASSLTHEGRIEDAEKQILYLQRIGEQAYGKRDPRMSPVLCMIGNWYVDTGNFQLGRDRFREAMALVERKLGKHDPALVEPLRSLARSYMQEIYFVTQGFAPPQERTLDFQGVEPKAINPKYISSDGEKALERALALLDARPDTTPMQLTETLIQLGDWFQLKHQPEKALAHYRRAAEVVASMSSPSPEAAAALSFPVRIYYPLPPLAMRNRQLSRDQVEEKYVSVEFTVTGTGDVQDAKVIEQNGTSRQASETLEAIRASRFRPKFVDGEPVDTQGVVSREVFKMRKAQPEEEKQS